MHAQEGNSVTLRPQLDTIVSSDTWVPLDAVTAEPGFLRSITVFILFLAKYLFVPLALTSWIWGWFAMLAYTDTT